MMPLKIRTSTNRPQPTDHLVPGALLFLLLFLDPKASVTDAFSSVLVHTITDSTNMLRKSQFGLFPHGKNLLRRHGSLHRRAVSSCRSILTKTSLQEDDEDGSTATDKDSQSALEQYLQKSRDRALDEFVATDAPSWMLQDENETLPFSCTGCGKCCQTVGSVFMSPTEYTEAADYLKISPTAFIQQYASHTLPVSEQAASTETAKVAAAEPWICLKDKQAVTEDAAPACIFLDRTTNFCQIYPVRPVQCRTYPFWPTVTASVAAWNAECRLLETNSNDSDTDGSSSSDTSPASASLPRWTPDLGGCEGMRLVEAPTPTDGVSMITNNNDKEDEAAAAALTTTGSPEQQQLIESVPRRAALELLYEYVQDERRFPHGAPEVSVE
jgi:Fe-S-cluster containining protein